MDEAYKAVKQIKNPEVWENMAHMVRIRLPSAPLRCATHLLRPQARRAEQNSPTDSMGERILDW